LTDATSDSPVDSTTSDSSDARGADADAAPLAPLQWCPMLDSDWGIDTDAAGCATSTTSRCPDRANNWVADIVPNNYAVGGLTTDCRISAMLAGFSAQDGIDYNNQLSTWTLALFGCPEPSDGAALPFGLIPPTQSGHVFSSADLKLLSDLYVQAVNDAIASPTPGTTPPSLTQSQLDQLNAQLAAQAAAVPNRFASSTYTFDSCPDASSDGGADGGGG
jgi:hypothetical protein